VVPLVVVEKTTGVWWSVDYTVLPVEGANAMGKIPK
jgi:hypothetical protein